HTEMIQKRVIDHHADVGIALDGDADRVILIDEHAQVVDGDTIMAILAGDMQKKGKLKNNKLVATVMSNYGLIKAMRDIGVEVVQARVGDRYVIQEMLDHGAILGGEQSGHLICLEHNTTGDALIAALQVLAIMVERDMPLSELARVITKYPQTLLNVPVAKKPELETLESVQKAIQSVEVALKGDGRTLVRYSGTENICRVLVEGSNSKKVEAHAQTIAHAIHEAIGV
ncbi:MAG: phosphoglucosamine mutase, partial [Chlamydiia bacterium]|nr:phosphoglucosamine mutase [Chlamydiia bacterium]